jgi:hypothetical protein
VSDYLKLNRMEKWLWERITSCRKTEKQWAKQSDYGLAQYERSKRDAYQHAWTELKRLRKATP